MTEYHRLKRVGEDMEHRDRTTQNTFRRKITNALERLLEEDIDSVGGTSGERGMGDTDEGDKEDKKPRDKRMQIRSAAQRLSTPPLLDERQWLCRCHDLISESITIAHENGKLVKMLQEVLSDLEERTVRPSEAAKRVHAPPS